MIADPAGASQVFTDDEVQDALDAHRMDVRYLELTAAETLQQSGPVLYKDYYAPYSPWESDETLVNGSWAAVTPTTAERFNGHWTFAAGQDPPVYIIGKVFDLYGAAADLLETWAAKLKLEFDFSADGQSFQRAQKATRLLELAGEYRQKQRPVVIRQVRADAAPASAERWSW